ncbi:M14 family metallopeptidase [Actinoplanes sp. NBRC 103695]|uniref:M14 family metallopeptidase n=1 Tax=Actinoplanes sp. NBRC 103695 TaxID=3032202 RepID=UPI0024A2926C|nr:M14 family metallopeptidase [Actinoplanes sp. NBRC 103695]GLY95329.1 zinc carboxypeptidase [Actinoplanes sp. NBRC 103695]
MRRTIAAAAAALLPLAWIVAGPATGAAAAPDGDRLRVWQAQVTEAQVDELARAGADTTEIDLPEGGRPAPVELVLSGAQADGLRKRGVRLTERKAVAPAGDGVFRPYSGSGGIADELRAVAAAHPGITKLESIGKTVRGQDILAIKVTRDATRTKDGARPGSFFFGAQHAREWITPEVTRRLLHQVVDQYGTDQRITGLVDTTEMWFLPVANPDGYDYTFTDAPGARLWRKNLRDNNGDGKLTVGDGVDLNRNFDWKWGYDDEGSSADPGTEIYRGPGPASEPENIAFNAFERRVKPELALNMHSAAQVLMYGVGWQTATPTPDDVLYRSLVGVEGNPAVPGFRPQILSDISTSNGDSAGNSVNTNGVPMIAAEHTTCQAAAGADPADEWTVADCPSVFNFPDSEKLIQAEFAKNLPFMLSVAASASDPANPVSSVGITAAPLTAHPFTTSYAGTGPQTVAVTARKSLAAKKLHWRIDGGKERTAAVTPWTGGQVYGGTDNLWYDEYRGRVTGAKPGAAVEVWFTGGSATSGHFTYRVAAPRKGDVLVLADEGAPATNAKLYADAIGKATVWDVATQGTPDDLGVLSHFDAVVWEVAGKAAAPATTLAVRDYLNSGGKLVKAGRGAAAHDPLAGTGVNADDFAQYWLGVDSPATSTGATGFTGGGVLQGATATLKNPANPVTMFSATGEVLPHLPRFASAPAGVYQGLRGPFEPFTGAGQASIKHRDNAYARLTRTADLSAATAAQNPQLSLALSVDTEPGWDALVIEARTAGGDDWTTLPFTGSGSTVPEDCAFLVGLHPELARYLTPDGPTCTATGTTGAWHSVTGTSNGWKQISADLSRYAGKSVELSVTYLSDGSTGGRGAFVDDAKIVIGGTEAATDTFEENLGAWSAAAGEWQRTGAVLRSYAAVSTQRTVTLGFGLEDVASGPAALRKALGSLG